MSIEAMKQAIEALEEIALAGMSGTGQESEEGLRDWHARQAWKFIGIAARALEPIRTTLSQQPATPKPVGFTYQAEIAYADSTGGNGSFWRVPPDLDDEAVPLYTHPAPSVPATGELEPYDAGLLNDFGGGNVEWWQDYIRAELGHAHDFYQSQITTPQPAQATQAEVTDEQIESEFQQCGGKWNGDQWVIEDADLHPFCRTILALRPAAVPMTDAAREHFLRGYESAQQDALVCRLPPEGWACTRTAGHEGPCAAVPTDDGAFVKRGMDRLRESHNGITAQAKKEGA